MTTSNEPGRSRRRWLAALALAASAGCAGSILGDDPRTGISALVLRGPIQPVVREGEVNEEPVPGATVRVRRVGGGSAEARTDAEGSASVRLEPGRYRVDVTVCPGALALPGEETVDVVADAMTSLTLSCDTGIR